MDWLHVHLLVNHLPVIGSVVLLPLLAYGLLRARPEVVETVLGALAVLAVGGVVVYLTGEPAEEVAEGLPAFSEALMERHEEAAKVATVVLGLCGALALGAVIAFRGRMASAPAWVGRLALLLALASAGTMGYAAWLGGQLGHPEIRSGVAGLPSPASTEGDLER